MAPSNVRRFDARILLVGLIAGMGFGMIEMVNEAIVGKGFWAPLPFIAWVFTLGKDTDPSFSFLPVVVGLMGHMMNSVIFGLIFALVLSRIASGVIGLTLTGMAYAVAIFAAMWLVALRPHRGVDTDLS